MAIPRLNLNAFFLAVVTTAGVLCIQHSLRKSEQLDHIHPPLVDEAAITEARLLRSITEGPSERQESVQLPVYISPNASTCRDIPVGSKGQTFDGHHVKRALGYRSAIAGFHKKAGMLSAIQWRPEYKNDRNIAASYWFASPQNRRARCAGAQPPLQFPGCTVLINHHYKFIWIRGARVGGSVIEASLEGVCSNNGPDSKSDSIYCSEALHDNKEVSIKDVQAYWDSYFVFAFVRNPYARFASAYTYVSGLMGSCPKLVNFEKLCDSPFLLVKVCSTLSCCWPGAITHHMHHAIEQSNCLFTDKGEIAVDFIGQTETLSKDLRQILHVINKRKASNLPDLQIKNGSLPKMDDIKHRRPLQLFTRSSTCLSKVEHYYWKDFALLGYRRIAAFVQ